MDRKDGAATAGRNTTECKSSSSSNDALIAGYRAGLGLAAVVAIRGPAGIRIVAQQEGDTGCPLAADEAVQVRWWCRRASEAREVAAAANARLRLHLSANGEQLVAVGTTVLQAARRRHVALLADRDVTQEAMSVIARVEAEIEELRRSGGLKSVNKSYQRYRIEASPGGERVQRYAEWIRDYKAELVRKIAANLRYL